jgi:hypothetical protein
MSYESSAPYRGYCIEVRVTPCRSLSFHGMGCRFRVSWSIFPRTSYLRRLQVFQSKLNFCMKTRRSGTAKVEHTLLSTARYLAIREAALSSSIRIVSPATHFSGAVIVR